MTATEILDSLSSTLISDDRILSVREKELIATLLQRAKTDTGTRDHAVTEIIARAVGEVIAQRAYGILGSSISERLVDEVAGSASLRGSPHPPSPSPPGPGRNGHRIE
ncbi:MAG TPA: hypothetical protein VH744_09250, partial [Terriglobales bacterium]